MAEEAGKLVNVTIKSSVAGIPDTKSTVLFCVFLYTHCLPAFQCKSPVLYGRFDGGHTGDWI